jgi:hypothetical protein
LDFKSEVVDREIFEVLERLNVDGFARPDQRLNVGLANLDLRVLSIAFGEL